MSQVCPSAIDDIADLPCPVAFQRCGGTVASRMTDGGASRFVGKLPLWLSLSPEKTLKLLPGRGVWQKFT